MSETKGDYVTKRRDLSTSPDEIAQLRRQIEKAQDEITFYRENWYETGRTLGEVLEETEQLRRRVEELEDAVAFHTRRDEPTRPIGEFIAAEDDLECYCGQCGAVMQIVRPGKYQCPACE